MRRLLSTAVSKNFEFHRCGVRAMKHVSGRQSRWTLHGRSATDFAGGGHGAQILLIGCV
jgi:hypothetical protein